MYPCGGNANQWILRFCGNLEIEHQLLGLTKDASAPFRITEQLVCTVPPAKSPEQKFLHSKCLSKRTVKETGLHPYPTLLNIHGAP